MKRPTTLLRRVLVNLGLQASLTVERDCQEIDNRFEHEGWSFLTITLPSLSDALETGLKEGRITPSMFMGFKPHKRGGKLPALLSGFFMRVFERDGSLKAQPCTDSIAAIRQAARLFKKVLRPCSSARITQAYERYVTNDEELFEQGSNPTRGDFLFRYVSGCLWSGLETLSEGLYCSPGVFGTGATAERALYNARHTVKAWPERGEDLFPSSYHCGSREDDTGSFAGIDYLADADETPVRVVDVPKTLKGPRVISIEPSHMMLRQQSVCWQIMDWLQDGVLGFSSIRFTDQTVNRDLARRGSIDGLLATIDLKDASDRVSLALVEDMLQTCPTFLAYALGSRSSRATLPNGEVRTLKRFASMGSALCFPIEAMVFLTLAVCALVERNGRYPSPTKVRKIANDIAVYGDDIIVPSETAPDVMGKLEAYRLKVNHDKSFHTGFFRESCGGDYYAGVDVTPVYVRRWDESGMRLRGSVLASYVSLSNQFYMKGLWHVCQRIRDHIGRTGSGNLARTTRPVGVLTYRSVHFSTRLRWDVYRHCWRVRGPKLSASVQPDRTIDIRGAMLLSFGRRFQADYRTEAREAGFSRKWRSFDRHSLAGPVSRTNLSVLEDLSLTAPARDSPHSGSERLSNQFDEGSFTRRGREISHGWEDPGHLTGVRLLLAQFGIEDTGVSVKSQSLKTKIGWALVNTGVFALGNLT